MKITNQFVGLLVWTLFSSISILYWLEVISLPTENEEITPFSIFILSISGISLLLQLTVLVVGMLTDDIRFSYTIPTPFSVIKSYYQKKEKSLKTRDRLLQQLFDAKTEEEIDLINKKLNDL